MTPDLVREIEALREAVRSARAMPMSASAVINRQEFLDAIDRLEEKFSAATTESFAVVSHRDAVIDEAEKSAAEIVRQANLKREQLVSDTEVFRIAQREAEQLLEATRAEAQALREDADAYIEQRFANFEHSLERTLAEVRRGIANLSGRNAFDKAAGPDVDRSDDVLLANPDAG